VAFLALGRKSHSLMVWRAGLQVGRPVAAHTFGGQTLTIELPHGADRVTGVTIRNRMRSDQRKTVLVFVDHVDRYLPAMHGVAKIALGAVLPTMDIGVAILAVVSHVGEKRVKVAFLTPDAGMHTPQ
jgi:hypothetical protein